MKQNKVIKAQAEYIIKKLKELGVVIHRYNAYSTNSIYLKLDYGVCNSIRISDHAGKQHLSYRYNIGTDLTLGTRIHNGYKQYFYPMYEVDLMLEMIKQDRQAKIDKYGMDKYEYYMVINKQESQDKKGFWQGCKLIE